MLWRCWLVPRMYRTGIDELIMSLEVVIPTLIIMALLLWWAYRAAAKDLKRK